MTITEIKIATTCQFVVYILIKRFEFSNHNKSIETLSKYDDSKFLIFLCAIKLFTIMNQNKQYSTRKIIENFIYNYIKYIIKNIKIYYFYLLYNIKIINLFLISFLYRKMYNILTQNTLKCITSFCRREK